MRVAHIIGLKLSLDMERNHVVVIKVKYVTLVRAPEWAVVVNRHRACDVAGVE